MKDYAVKYTEVGTGETIYYRETEANTSKPVLLLIHGNMSSSIHFQTLMEQLEDSYHCIAPDLPGFGDSTYNHEHHSLLDFAKDIEKFVNALSLTDFEVLGWSTGGGIALELAYLLPKQVKRVYLMSSVGVKGYPMYKKNERFEPIMTERLTTKEDIAADPVQVLPVLEMYKNNNKVGMKAIWDAAIYNDQKPEKEEYDRYLTEILRQVNLVDIDYSLVHFNITTESNGVTEGSGHIHKIKCPIVILHGTKDYVVPIADAQLTKKVFGEQATMHVFEGAGHALVTGELARVVEIVKGNLGGA